MTDPEDPPEPRSEATPRTFRLVLEYEGTHFEGWQVQTRPGGARTVQGVLEAELCRLAQGAVRVRGAGRTDAVVHAMAQVASAGLTTRLDAKALLRALNARLPRDLAVREVAAVPTDWDALREARAKHYRYQIWNGRARSPLRAMRFAWIAERLDLEAMRQSAAVFVGRHDFAAFQGAGSDTKTTVRTLTDIELSGRSGHEIRIDVSGEGFLRHMVRNLAGTLIEIGRGRWDPARAAEILSSRDRGQAGPTAPAPGLILVEVRDSWSQGRLETGDSRDSVDDGHPVG